MKATLLSYRRGRHTVKMNQFLLEIEGCDTRAKAAKYIGKRVCWTSPGKLEKKIFGTIMAPHGSSGVLRAMFTRGLPGEAANTKVELAE